MHIGDVRTFPSPKPNKEQVVKILEEAAEVYSAWEDWNDPKAKRRICSECADLIMATSNLLASIGVSDMSSYIKECEKVQEMRGRYDVPSNYVRRGR